MARPNKQGLDYFPFDVDFFNDEKIEAISGEFGLKGEITAIKLLCTIYRNGYFIEWSDLYKMKLLKSLQGISVQLLDEILSRLVKWGFFDKELFDRSGILTSAGIQKRYFEITRRRKGSENLPHLLIDTCSFGVNVDTNSINVNNNPCLVGINVGNNAQSKVKESKGNISISISDRERENFLEILFFEKRVLFPQKELERFLNHYDKTGWLDKNGNMISNRCAALKNWKTSADCKSSAKLSDWEVFYREFKEKCPSEDLSFLLTDIRDIKIDETHAHFAISNDRIKNFIEKNIQIITPVFQKLYPKKNLNYLIYVKR